MHEKIVIEKILGLENSFAKHAPCFNTLKQNVPLQELMSSDKTIPQQRYKGDTSLFGIKFKKIRQNQALKDKIIALQSLCL